MGRRVAYWRVRRRMSQQVFADRLGKSKSWVDKVERGVRALDKVSTLADIAAVLRIDQAVLLGRDVRPVEVCARVTGVERIRVALSTYDVAVGRRGRDVPLVAEVARVVQHAWTTFQHARYPQVIGGLPEMVLAAQRSFDRESGAGRVPLVEAYRVSAALLVKLGAGELAWLAADRAMSVATGDAVLVAAAAVQLGQVLRATGRSGCALPMLRAAAYRIARLGLDGGPAERQSLCGALLVQAALAAASHGDARTAADLLNEAGELASRVGDGHDHYRTGFGPAAVADARTLAAVEVGDAAVALAWHQRTIGEPGWGWLPAEHRAAHLIDTARAHLQADDPVNAARRLLGAERIAPGEVRHRRPPTTCSPRSHAVRTPRPRSPNSPLPAGYREHDRAAAVPGPDPQPARADRPPDPA
ncbi:helix-turn-helix domain-containing protein [Micromonospora sp. FIMYZ51]|uniref:helix-turn-helix domain-containing protein n=1 Tax=Micromonospora sp. FIMYZ51 TaxID=3051832 RepID=UPI00311E5A6C